MERLDVPRARLFCLWISQTARVLADWCLRMAVVATLTDDRSGGNWHLATATYIAPFIFLAPLNGILSNSLPRFYILIGSAAGTLVVTEILLTIGVPWLTCLFFMALGTAIYSPARYAMIPAAAQATGLTVPRVNGLLEIGSSAAIVFGAWLGLTTPIERLSTMLLGLNAVCLAFALPVRFPGDVIRPESLRTVLHGFFRDVTRIWRVGTARSSLLALALFQAIITAGSGALVLNLLALAGSGTTGLLLSGVGTLLGCGVAALQGHPRRSLGLVPVAVTGLLLALALASAIGAEPAPFVLLGFFGGLANVPLRSAYLAAVPADARGNATAAMNFVVYIGISGLALLLLGGARIGLLTTPATQLHALAVLTALGAVVAWRFLFAPALENAVELVVAPFYRVRAVGPGVGQLPTTGPLLIVANHSAYLDPFWLAKVVPRQIRPMMTSVFYDKPGIRWLSAHVARAIRVPATSFRREAPELEEAIAALRADDCVVVFPEAILRRKEEQLTRPFGQGVWHILQALPTTPVCTVWIEGGWGSYFSYRDGPPGKNKRLQWRRPIDLAMTLPAPLAPAILADQRHTRQHLRQSVLAARTWLGLPVATPDDDAHQNDS